MPADAPAAVPAAPAAPSSTPAAPAAAAVLPAVPAPAADELVGAAHGMACHVVEGLPMCTHDHEAHEHASTGSTATAPEVRVGCHGDGRSGNRVQVVYVRQSDRADRFGSVLGAIRREVNVANGVFTRSSENRRQLRVVTDGSCAAAVERLTITPAQASSFAETAKAVRASGRVRVDRKYLLFIDNDRGCGIAEQYLDDRAGTGNRNNDGNMVAAVYTRCWRGVTVAHELTHVFGGVQPSAPRSTGNYAHCTDQHDVMCYRDGSGKAMTTRCATSHATLLDCGRDDYFSIAPPAGSYLARHWNTAGNSFLVGGGAPVPTPPSVPTSVGSTRSGDNVRVTWGTPEQARSGVTAFDVVDLAASGKVLATVAGTARTATVTLTPWQTYRIAVVARNGAGKSAAAGGHEHMVGRPPAAPSAVTALPQVNGTGTDVRLSWGSTARATSYVILRDGRQVGTSSTPVWTDKSTLKLGQMYTYTVQARNVWGTSPSSSGAPAVGI